MQFTAFKFKFHLIEREPGNQFPKVKPYLDILSCALIIPVITPFNIFERSCWPQCLGNRARVMLARGAPRLSLGPVWQKWDRSVGRPFPL